MTKRSTRNSRRLSWLLRHAAIEEGLAMDEAGWTEIADVLDLLGLREDELLEAVETNDKGRLQVEGDRIRACQGHSLIGMPVTYEALEASWSRVRPASNLWHGTTLAAVPGIAERGIEPGTRTHVHLAVSPTSRVGKRASVEVLFAISPARLEASGVDVFRAPNGVLLVRHVPTEAIVGLRAGPPLDGVDLAPIGERHGIPTSDGT